MKSEFEISNAIGFLNKRNQNLPVMNQNDEPSITHYDVFNFLNEDFKSRELPPFYVEQKRILLTLIKVNSLDSENDKLDLFQLDDDVYQTSQRSIENCNDGSDPVQLVADRLEDNQSELLEVFLKGGYIELIRGALESIVACFNEFHYWGYETRNELFDEFITERLNKNWPKLMPGCFLEKSMSAEIIDTILFKIKDESYLPDCDELNTMCQHLTDFHKLLKLILWQHASNHGQLMEEVGNDIYHEEDPQVLIEYSRTIGRELINETLHPDFKRIKEHVREQLEYFHNIREFNGTKSFSLSTKGLEQLSTNLSWIQRSKLFDLLQKGKFIPNENIDSFIWALGSSDETMPDCWQPIKWEESKLSLRELLTPFLQTITNQQIRIIEKLFLDKHCNPLKMNKLPKVDEHSARCLDIEKIVAHLMQEH